MVQRSVAGTALAAGGLAFEMSKKWWVLLLRGLLLLAVHRPTIEKLHTEKPT